MQTAFPCLALLHSTRGVIWPDLLRHETVGAHLSPQASCHQGSFKRQVAAFFSLYFPIDWPLQSVANARPFTVFAIGGTVLLASMGQNVAKIGWR